MRAFHNDKNIKQKYLMRVRQHRAADELIHGKYWENWRGCAVGCTIHGSDHAAYEEELGIPRTLAWLEDRIFENLPNPNAADWPEAFLSSIRIGADLSHVSNQFMIWLLMDKEVGLIRFASEQGKPAIEHLAALAKRRLAGKIITDDEWLDTLWLVGDVIYADATYAAADAAINAARLAIAPDNPPAAIAHAAESAADAATSLSGATSRTHFVRMAEKLLDLLESAPVPAEI